MASAGAFCANPPSSERFSGSKLSFYQFNHDPQTNDINSVIEHLDHHTLHATFVLCKNGWRTLTQYVQ